MSTRSRESQQPKVDAGERIARFESAKLADLHPPIVITMQTPDWINGGENSGLPRAVDAFLQHGQETASEPATHTKPSQSLRPDPNRCCIAWSRIPADAAACLIE
jgi:hypothetical protein